MTQPDRKSNDAVEGLRELAAAAIRTADELDAEIRALIAAVLETFHSGGRLFFCGNGGSAADAQHLAAEYVVRFRAERPGLSAMALTTDSSILTAAGNDFGFQEIFARQIQALARPGDLLILHSTSGESGNLLRAAEEARKGGVRTAALLAGRGGRLREMVDLPLVVPTSVTARAQELHLAIGHLVCDGVERELGRAAAARTLDPPAIEAIEGARRAERRQARFYRALAAAAGEAGDAAAEETLNELHADEQHHLARLTSRLLELGIVPGDVEAGSTPGGLPWPVWHAEARAREAAEVAAYEALLASDVLDPDTRIVVLEILESERHHHSTLGGKWMSATPPLRAAE
jgi:D-sedoheptulose 7-phosphate isomerase